MNIKLWIAIAITCLPVLVTAQAELDEGLKGKIDVLCIGPLMGIEQSYVQKKKPMRWNFNEAQNHVRSVMGNNYSHLVNVFVPILLNVVNNATGSVRDERDRTRLTIKLVTLSNMCVKELREKAAVCLRTDLEKGQSCVG